MVMACVRPQQEEEGLEINLCGSQQSPVRPGAGVEEGRGRQTSRHREATTGQAGLLSPQPIPASRQEPRLHRLRTGQGLQRGADSPLTLLSGREGEEQ